MKLRLCGFVQNKGTGVDKETGEAFEFDSIVLECLSSMPPKGKSVVAHGGRHYKKVKIKACDLDAVTEGVIKSAVDLKGWIGKMIMVDGTSYFSASGQYISADEIFLAEEK